MHFWLSSRNFFRGAKSVVMQISFVMLLLSDQISGGAKFSRGVSPCPPPVEEASIDVVNAMDHLRIVALENC